MRGGTVRKSVPKCRNSRRRLKAGGSQDWLPHSQAHTRYSACHRPLVHPTHARIATHPAAGAPGHLSRLRAAGDVRGEGGMLLRQMLLAARGTFDARCVDGAAYQLLELLSAIVTAIFKDRHIGLLHYKRTDAIHDAAHLGSRTSVAVGALSTAIAMMASVGIMVGSFRET